MFCMGHSLERFTLGLVKKAFSNFDRGFGHVFQQLLVAVPNSYSAVYAPFLQRAYQSSSGIPFIFSRLWKRNGDALGMGCRTLESQRTDKTPLSSSYRLSTTKICGFWREAHVRLWWFFCFRLTTDAAGILSVSTTLRLYTEKSSQNGIPAGTNYVFALTISINKRGEWSEWCLYVCTHILSVRSTAAGVHSGE